MVDYHIHSSLSGDCDTPAEDILKAAVSKGLTDICFTEHMDLDFPEEMFDFSLDFNAYDAMRARILSLAEGKINVHFGVEAGMQIQVLPETERILFMRSFDFIIGSVHVADGKDVYIKKYFKGKTQYEAFKCYLETIYKNIVQFNAFDIVGHLDYPAKGAPYDEIQFSYAQYADQLDAIFKYIIPLGKGIEVNTSVYRYIHNKEHGLDYLRRYKALGGEIITVGSDAHTAEFVGYSFERACNMLKQAGFSHYTIFKGHKPTFRKLP